MSAASASNADDTSSRPRTAAKPGPSHSDGRTSASGDESERREREKVSARQRLEHEPSRQVERVFDSRRREQPIECQEGEREEREVLILDLGESRERHGIERQSEPLSSPARRLPGPSAHHQARRPACQREAENEHEVVREHRRGAGRQQRRRRSIPGR